MAKRGLCMCACMDKYLCVNLHLSVTCLLCNALNYADTLVKGERLMLSEEKPECYICNIIKA